MKKKTYIKLHQLILDQQVTKASKIIIKHQMSLNDIQWEMSQDYDMNTIEVSKTLLNIADRILGQLYKKKKENTRIIVRQWLKEGYKVHNKTWSYGEDCYIYMKDGIIYDENGSKYTLIELAGKYDKDFYKGQKYEN